MSKMYGVLLPFCLAVLLLHQSKAIAKEGREDGAATHQFVGTIGAVVDYSSRVGKEQKTAMEIAAQDFYGSTGSKLLLYVRDSYGDSARATSAAIDLINNKRVEAIMGTLTRQEAALVPQMAKEVPIISLAEAAFTPTIISAARSPFVVSMVNDISLQMKCIAAIIGSFRWRKVIVIYENSDAYSSDSGIVTLLSDSLRVVGTEIQHHSAFPPMSSLLDPTTIIQDELKKLRRKQCRVFIVLQSSLPLAALLFDKAQQLGMMGKGYVWITTDGITSLLDSVNSSVISSMQGVLGVKTYFPDNTTSFTGFKVRFRRKFQSEYPEEEENPNPSIFALRAYDATWSIAQAMERLGPKNNPTSLLQGILSSHFKGLSGEIQFNQGELSQVPTFRITNVVGKSYKELGFWSPKFSFSEDLVGYETSGEKGGSSNRTVQVLGPVYWPGGLQSVPVGWAMTIISNSEEKPLRIGVPARGAFNQFVRVSYDESRNRTYITGFSVHVFEAAVKLLPYQLSYELVPFYGSYDDMVEEVYYKSSYLLCNIYSFDFLPVGAFIFLLVSLHNTDSINSFMEKNFDAAVGDTVIMADRCRYGEFSQPYVESGLVMVVPTIPERSQERWMFMKPFTIELWVVTLAMSMFTGFVVWLIERKDNPDFQGTFSYQIGTLLWFSITMLFSGQSKTSNFLIVTSTFTASLTSMMTVSRLEPSLVDIGLLKRTNAGVGCNGNSFIVRYLVNVLDFKLENIKRISSIDDYPEAFSSKNIAAAFFVVPHAKVFLAKYCKGYTMAGPTYKLGGFGFVFSKGSPLAMDISEAILRVTESGEIEQLENNMLSSSNCSTSQTGIRKNQSLDLRLFSGLFALSGSVSAFALLITVAQQLKEHWQFTNYIQATLIDKGIWRWALNLLARDTNNQGNDPYQEEMTDYVKQCSRIVELASNQSTENCLHLLPDTIPHK
ncbi:hypothetical protein HHK36_002587 [Tetracentron sinense]|uniref:Glutamate receptor n=1 Tax=Tetracentron sinense TaxID=13715 RepID=A0A834ZR30_TETSI|nr:hypothetical protein HHK36_002587 [Tetracentron sinense]